jgi:ferredoxin
VYARWPYLYIGIGTGEHRLVKILGPLVSWFARRLPVQQPKGYNTAAAAEATGGGKPDHVTFADTYHGKVVPLRAAAQLVTVKEEICIENLETVIPYARARDIILKNPDHIAVLDCPCRVSRPDPCLPLDVCLIIGEPFASFITEHQPERARWITPTEAVEILQAEDGRGHVHHAFFKDAMLGRFYAICNCCECCCGAMQAQRQGTPMLASSGYIAVVNEDLCIGCGECREYCQFGALALNEIHAVVDQENCMGCGVCSSKCQQGALVLVREASKGEPLEIFELMDRAKKIIS